MSAVGFRPTSWRSTRHPPKLPRPWTLFTEQMGRLADFVLDRGVDVDALFTDRWKLSEAVKAYDWFDRQSSGKGVIVPERRYDVQPTRQWRWPDYPIGVART